MNLPIINIFTRNYSLRSIINKAEYISIKIKQDNKKHVHTDSCFKFTFPTNKRNTMNLNNNIIDPLNSCLNNIKIKPPNSYPDNTKMKPIDIMFDKKNNNMV